MDALIQSGNIYLLPIIHYNMEMATQVRLAYQALRPDCVAVVLSENMQLQLLHGASRFARCERHRAFRQRRVFHILYVRAVRRSL